MVPCQFARGRINGVNACTRDSALPHPELISLYFLVREMPSLTPSPFAFCRVAPSVRLSLRAITVVFVFSRASVFSVRTSSFVHGRSFVFFAILFPRASVVPESTTIVQ